MRQLKITKSITNRQTISLDRYLQDISKIDLIDAEKEVELARNIKAGCALSLERLCSANLRFVVSVAKQYQNQGLSLPDLINEGNLGLIRAAQKFDETRGFKFISYAVWWIRQSILQAVAEQSRIVRLPLNKIGTINKVRKTYVALEQLYEREPLSFEIAESADMTETEVRSSLKNTKRHLSMDAPVSNDVDSNNLYDLMQDTESIVPDRELLHESLVAEIELLLGSLSEREAQIIRLFYGLSKNQEHSLEEIGDYFDLTRERVRQIKERAVGRLKSNSHSKILKSYLG